MASPATRKRKSGNQLLGLGVAACALIIVGAVVSQRFMTPPAPPPPPPPPPPPEQNVGRVLKYSATYYQSTLDEAAKRYKVAAVKPDELAQPFAYADELTTPRRLKVEHDKLETPHLTVSSRVIKEWASTSSGQRFRFEHIVLSITNKTSKPLAYRVITTVNHPESCQSQGAIAHNAVALAPGETIERTECLWHKDAELVVRGVDVVELPPIGYWFVSTLRPDQIGLDPRTAAGHTPPPPAKECNFVPWRDIQASEREQHTGWPDVVDFYGRHDCTEYSYYRGYHRWTAPGVLPARAPTVAAAERVDPQAPSK